MYGMLTGSRVADMGQASPGFQAARDIMRRTAPLRTVDVPAGPYGPAFSPRQPAPPPRLGPAWTDVPEYRSPAAGPIPPADEPLYYGMPHVGPVQGGYVSPTPPMTREEVLEAEEEEILRRIQELEGEIWRETVRGPTARAGGRVLFPVPAGGGMTAFPGM